MTKQEWKSWYRKARQLQKFACWKLHVPKGTIRLELPRNTPR